MSDQTVIWALDSSGRGYVRVEDYEALKTERDALKAAAAKGTEYVLAHINQDLRTERDAAVEYAERMTCAVRLAEIDLKIERKRRERAEAFIDAARGET